MKRNYKAIFKLKKFTIVHFIICGYSKGFLIEKILGDRQLSVYQKKNSSDKVITYF